MGAQDFRTLLGMPLSGVMAALATPLDAQRKLDIRGLHKLLDKITSNSVSGICPAGSTGEGPLLPRDFRVSITSEVSKRLGPNIWNIPATVSTTVDDTITDIKAYADVGATAVLVTVPYYYPLSSAAVLNWYEQILENTPLPILIYNIPQFTKVSIAPSIVEQLARNEMVIGMKDSSRDFEYFQSVLNITSGSQFSLLTGSDTMLLSSGMVGAKGTIAASVNLVPELVCALWDAILNGDWESGHELQSRLMEVVLICRKYGFPAGWKAALSLVGLCSAQVASPNLPIGPFDCQHLSVELKGKGLEVIGSA